MIKIITGRQSDPLQTEIIGRAARNYLAQPGKDTFIIVPNHIKFNTEVAAIGKVAQLQGREETSVKNLHVLSFSRLAWFFFKKADLLMPESLDDAAATMILEQIIDKRRDELLLFKNSHANSGMIKQVYSTILQVHTGQLDLGNLLERAADPAVALDLDNETRDKLHDLDLIYQDFLEIVSDKHFATKDELNIQLNQLLASRPDLVSQASFYVTDFSHFSIQEKMTMQLLAAFASDMTFAFKTADGSLLEPVAGEYDYVVQKTIRDLTGYFSAHDFAWESEKIARPASPARDLNQAWQGESVPDLKNLQLVKADSRYAEAYFVARTIYDQVALKGCQYRDFLVLAPNLQEYETYLAPILRQNQIPFFDDLQQQMKYHPLVILLENLGKLLQQAGDTPALLSIMKTRLLIPDWYFEGDAEAGEAAYLRDVDQLENFALAHGIKYSLWQKPLKDFTKAQVIDLDQEQYQKRLDRLDKLRDFFVSKISRLARQLKSEKDSMTAVKLFFDFLVKNRVSARLEAWRLKASEEGDLQQAQQPEQCWNLLLSLLKDYLLVNPENFAWADFFKMLTAAFSQANFATIPASLDAVTLSEYGMVQTSGYKQVFIIGAANGSLPQISDQPNFLTTENLASLADFFDQEAYLEDSQQLRNLDQEYQFGNALALASDRVYISYPVINSNNDLLDPSIYYKRLLKIVDGREYRQRDLPDTAEKDRTEFARQLLLFLTSPRASLGYLAYAEENSAQSPLVAKMVELSRQYEEEKAKEIAEGMAYDNNPQDISEDLAERLYGKDLLSSVSQLESYYQNSFEYFLNYGLRLRTRAENELNAIQSGNYFHRTFELLLKEMQKKNIEIDKLSELDLELLLKQVRSEILQEPLYQQFLRDPFNEYLFKAFDKTTSKVAQSYRRKQQENKMRATYGELAFGPAEKLAGLVLPLKKFAGQRKISLRGKIDRVDLFNGDQHVLGQLIDYKSSDHSFNLARFASGVDLQMIAYLDVLEKNRDLLAGGRQFDLLGAFYQYVTRKLNSVNSSSSTGALFDSKLQLKENLLGGEDKLKLSGVFVSEPAWYQEVDKVLEKKSSSPVYRGLKLNKSGTFGKKDNFFSQDEMRELLEYVEALIEDAASEILSGQIALNPFRQGNNTGLAYSDYKDIFYFDQQLPTNSYRDLPSLKKADLLALIEQRLRQRG